MSASRNFSDWIAAYCHYTRSSEAPDQFHFWTAISVLAGAVRRRVWVDMHTFQWVPNFYIVFVGPPGVVKKTTTMSLGLNLLKEIPNIHFGPSVITWQSLLDKLEESGSYFNLGTSDEPLLMPMSAITCSVGELGTFLKPGNVDMTDVLVSLWDGQTGVFEKATRTTKHNSIENPWINIIGCTTPSWMQGNFPEYMVGGGLTSRVVFVYGETKRQYVAFPDEDRGKEEFDAEAQKLIEDLTHIADLKGEFKISEEARQWGRNWYVELDTKRPIHLTDDRYSGYIARKQTHLVKLAMMLSIAQSDSLLIEKKHFLVADQMLEGVEFDMAKVFEFIGMSDAGRRCLEVLSLIRMRKTIKRSELFPHFLQRMSSEDFDAALNSLIRAGCISSMVIDNDPRLTFVKGAHGREDDEEHEPISYQKVVPLESSLQREEA